MVSQFYNNSCVLSIFFREKFSSKCENALYFRFLSVYAALWKSCTEQRRAALFRLHSRFFFPFCVVLLYGLFYAFTGFDKLWESREALAMQIFIFLLSLGFLYNQESLTNTVTFLTLLAVVPLHLMYCTGKSDPVEDGARVIRKAFLAVFPYTFGNFDVPYKKLFKGVRRGSKGQGVLFTVLGLICTIPFLIILTLLFSNADFAFAQSLSSILSYFYDLPVAKIIGTILLGVLMTVYILPLFFCAGCRLPAARSG